MTFTTGGYIVQGHHGTAGANALDCLRDPLAPSPGSLPSAVPPLAPAETTEYRSGLMRASLLSQDRPDFPEAIKRLAQGMAAPTAAHMADVERLARYVLGTPYAANRFHQQRAPKATRVSVNADHAGDKSGRRSTTAWC